MRTVGAEHGDLLSDGPLQTLSARSGPPVEDPAILARAIACGVPEVHARIMSPGSRSSFLSRRWFWLSLRHCGTGRCTIPATSSAGSALVSVYGSLEWNDQRLASHRDFSDGHAYVEPAFDATFEEEGVTKRIVVATLTPKPRREYSCHACSPILGGAVFRRDGDSWRREATGEVIQLSSAWHASLQLMQIGPDRYAILHQVNDVHGGAETRQASLIFVLATNSRCVSGPMCLSSRPGGMALPPQH